MKQFISLMLLLTVAYTNAQEIKFGEVTQEELKEQVCSIDSSANAAVLYKYRNTYFTVNTVSAEMVTEVHEKIKIYNKEGFDHATHELQLFKGGSTSEAVSKIKAITYNLENGEVVESKLEKNQIFKSEFNNNFNEVKFTMPNVKEGSVIEYKYKITSPYYWSVDEYKFQKDIPIKKIVASLRRPESFVFKPTYKGYLSFFPKTTKHTDSRIGETMVKETFVIDNVPAMKEEPFVDNINNYRAGVSYELSSINSPTRHRSFSQTWGDVAKSIGNSDDYKKQLDKSKSFNEELDALLEGVASKNEKMEKIFKYVKDNIKWNGYDGKYFNKGIKKALKEKKGNAADINLTLVAMLRYAGIDAHPIVISTKDNARPFFPTLDGLNFVVAYAVINEKPFFMDATSEFSDINMLPVRDYNWEGLLINNLERVWKKVSLSKPNQAMAQYQLKAQLSDDGSFEGSYKSKLIGHYAFNFRNGFKDEDEEEFVTSREDDFNDIEISDYEIENADVYEGNVVEQFNFYHEDGAEVLNDKIYFKPLSFLGMDENPFKSDERMYPIDFGYPFKDMYFVTIEIPEGYEVESNIKPSMMKTPNGNAEFRYSVTVMGNKISLSVNVNIKQAIYGAEDYLILKQFFNQIISKESEQIVLVKTKP